MYSFASKSLRGTLSQLTQYRLFYDPTKLPILKRKLNPTFETITVSRTITIFEKHPHGMPNYMEDFDLEPMDMMKIGYKSLKNECKMFLGEVKEHFVNDPKVYHHGDTDVIFRFDSEDCLNQWRVGYDKKYNCGRSECSFTVNNSGKGVFQGMIDKTPIKDGTGFRAGFCAIRSKKIRKSFFRKSHYNWSPFTHVELRCRGDGRAYIVLIGCPGVFDLTWLDLYCYYIFTRGGPYWETHRIPFSKFFLSSKGKVQDKQEAMNKNAIDSVGILSCSTAGPFKLELDYIGVHRDQNEKEKCAYEQYIAPKYYVSG